MTNLKKNNKTGFKSMTMLILIVIVMCTIMTNAVYQNQIIKWDFEEGTGYIAIDGSGNDNYGVISGATYSGISKFGDYSLTLNNVDTIETIMPIPETEIMTFNIWLRFHNASDVNTIIKVYNNTDDLNPAYRLQYSSSGEQLGFFYYDEFGDSQGFGVSETLDVNDWNMITLEVNKLNDTIKLYKDGILSHEEVNVSMPLPEDEVSLMLGSQIFFSVFDGQMDAFSLYDFALSDSQLVTLYSMNQITLIQEEEEPEINDTIIDNDLITSYTPLNNASVMPSDNIEVLLSEMATCQLYIDSSLMEEYNNIVGFSYPLTQYLNGDYEYFVYCSNIKNNTLNYDITNITSFNIEKPHKTIEFYIYDQDDNLLTGYDDLYLSTPCLTTPELNKYYVPDREIYFQKLVNGRASFNLSYEDNYNFCLLKGRINANADTYSLDYDLVDVKQNADLGKLFVNNETYTFSLKVDNTDLYKVTQPEFWGKTWEALFSIIISLLVGGGIIVLGIVTRSDKVALVGGIIIAVGLGFSAVSFLGLLA